MIHRWEEIRNRFFSPRKKTVAMVSAGRMFMADVQEGKYIRRSVFPLRDLSGQVIAEAFFQAAEEGFTDRDILLIHTFPDLRVTCKSFPSMTEEELEETMYWEQDRIFGTQTDLQIAWTPIEKGFDGWKVSLAGSFRDTLALWTSAAETAGKRIIRCIPVTEGVFREEPSFYLYGRKNSALLVFRDGTAWESRVLKPKDALEKMKIFTAHITENHEVATGNVCFVPLSDCHDDQIVFWTELIEAWKNSMKNPSISEETQEEIGVEEFSSEETEIGIEEDAPDIREETKCFLTEQELWSMVLPVMESAPAASMDFIRRSETDDWVLSENRWLRIGQGAAAILFVFCFGLACLLGFAVAEENRTEAKLAELYPVQQEMKKERMERNREDAFVSRLKRLEQEDSGWEQKLVMLSEYMPQGAVLSEITSENGLVRLQGTADSPATAARMEKNLKNAWGGEVRLERRKQEPHLKMATFTLVWQKGKGK